MLYSLIIYYIFSTDSVLTSSSQLLVLLFQRQQLLILNNKKKKKSVSIHPTIWTCMVVDVICMHFLEMKHGVEHMVTMEKLE